MGRLTVKETANIAIRAPRRATSGIRLVTSRTEPAVAGAMTGDGWRMAAALPNAYNFKSIASQRKAVNERSS